MHFNWKSDNSLPFLKCKTFQTAGIWMWILCVNRWFCLAAIWLNNFYKVYNAGFEMFEILFRGTPCMVISSKNDMTLLIMKVFKTGLGQGYLQSRLTGVNLHRPISGLLFAIHSNLQSKWLRICKGNNSLYKF